MDDQLPKPKLYRAPFWVMLIATILVAALHIWTYNTLKNLSPAAKRSLDSTLNLYIIGWPVLLLGETVIYWLISRKKPQKLYIWLHVSLIIFIFILVPFVSILANAFAARIYRPEEYFAYLRKISLFRTYTFWLFLVIGHAFFIATIVKSFTKRKVTIEGDEAAPGILDGILDEH